MSADIYEKYGKNKIFFLDSTFNELRVEGSKLIGSVTFSGEW